MITLDSDIGIKKIQVLYDSIRDEFKKSDEVIIDFSNVDRADLSVIQLVIAAGREAKSTGKTLKLKSMQRSIKYQMQICALKV